jgi:hypothetical protein
MEDLALLKGIATTRFARLAMTMNRGMGDNSLLPPPIALATGRSEVS